MPFGDDAIVRGGRCRDAIFRGVVAARGSESDDIRLDVVVHQASWRAGRPRCRRQPVLSAVARLGPAARAAMGGLSGEAEASRCRRNGMAGLHYTTDDVPAGMPMGLSGRCRVEADWFFYLTGARLLTVPTRASSTRGSVRKPAAPTPGGRGADAQEPLRPLLPADPHPGPGRCGMAIRGGRAGVATSGSTSAAVRSRRPSRMAGWTCGTGRRLAPTATATARPTGTSTGRPTAVRSLTGKLDGKLDGQPRQETAWTRRRFLGALIASAVAAGTKITGIPAAEPAFAGTVGDTLVGGRLSLRPTSG